MRLAKYFVFAGVIITAFAILPYVLFGVPETATLSGVLWVMLENVGFATPALIFGCLGLLYKPNRFMGFVIATLAIVALMLVGAVRAEAGCVYNGENMHYCTLPAGWG